MTITPVNRTRVLLCSFLLAVSFAQAGYTYEFVEKDSAGVGSTMTVLVDGKSIRMSGGGGSDETIYQSDKEALLVLEHDRKEYLLIDKKAVVKISSEIEKAMAEMEEQLAMVPPAQRQMMEQMMKGSLQQAPALPEVEIKRTGETDSIAGYECERVEIFADGIKTREAWIAPWDALEGADDIKVVFKSMSGMFEEMTKAFSQGPMAGMFASLGEAGAFEKLEELEGFPVKAVELDSRGNTSSETLLQTVTETDFDKDTFKAPKGYKRQKLEF